MTENPCDWRDRYTNFILILEYSAYENAAETLNVRLSCSIPSDSLATFARATSHTAMPIDLHTGKWGKQLVMSQHELFSVEQYDRDLLGWKPDAWIARALLRGYH
jgi:hypothetical protein